jgi:prepilin-type N-terminal cleavage/methylation domain-containing protein
MYKIKGITLIEILVVVTIVGIIMTGFSIMFIRAWQANKFSIEMGLASATAQRATNKMVIELRGVQQSAQGAYPLVSANDNELIVYTDIEDDGVVERVRYYLDSTNKQIKVGIREPNTATQPPTYANGDGSTIILANFVVNTSSEPLFKYFTDDYPTVTTALTTPANVGNIQLVKIDVHVNVDPSQAPNNINNASFVDLRNLHGL